MGGFTRRGRRLVRIAVAGAFVGALLPTAAFFDVAHAASRTWSGLGADANWSTGANWVGNSPPLAGDDLIFPAGPANKFNNNDFAQGTAFNSVTVQDAGYTMGGNGVELNTLDITAAGITGISWGNGNAGIVVPAGGTFTETIAVGAEVSQNITVDIGDGTVDYNVNGLLTTNHIFFPTDAGSDVIRRGTGTIKITQGSGPEIPWAIQSGVTYFNANNALGANVTQTGGIVGGNQASLTGYTTAGGTFSPGNDVFETAQMQIQGTLNVVPGGQYEADINGVNEYDRLFVTGAINLSGPLFIDASGFTPSGGQTYTLFSNDLADPVVGTFSGMPEGHVINLNGTDVTVSYIGGDGNDVTLSTGPAFVWDGEGANNNWTTALNWVGDIAPVGNADETLEFPASVVTTTNNNFIAGTSFKDIVFSNANYDLQGNPLKLTGGIVGNNGGFSNTLTLDVELVGGGTVAVPTAGAGLTIAGDLSADGGTITFAGGGAFTVSGQLINDAEAAATTGEMVMPGPNGYVLLGALPSFAGPITVNGGFLAVDDVLSQAEVVLHGGFLGGDGVAQGITADGGTVTPSDSDATPQAAILSSNGDVVLGAGSTFSADVDAITPGVGHDQLNVTGSVTLGGTLQAVSMNGGPPVGQTLVIINNDLADPVAGTFTGLPEGAVVTVNSIPMVVSYVGGTGNDVTLSTTAVVWDGGGADDNWMTAANWVGDVAPVPGPNVSLVFPDVAARKTNANNFAGPTPFKNILFTGSGYNLSGARPDLFGDLIATNTTGTNTLTFQVDLSANSTFTQASGGELVTQSTILVGLNTLTLAGDGTFRLNGQISGTDVDKTGGGLATFATSPTFSGTLTVNQGTAQLGGNFPAAVVVNGGALIGAGAIGSGITTNGTGAVAPGSATHGVLTTSIVAVSSPTASTGFDVNGNTPGVTQDQLVVNGPVTLDGFLGISTMAIPPINQEIVLISKTTAGPVSGTFAGVPEGGSVLIGGGPWEATISYVGGDGNDVTLFVPPTFTWDGEGANDDWTTSVNWTGNVAPSGNAGETLIFPGFANQLTNENTFPAGTVFEEIQFPAGATGYTLNGNALVLDQGITALNGAGSNTYNIPTSFTGNGVFSQISGGTLVTAGPVDLNGGTLTVTGAGNHTDLDEVADGDLIVATVASGTVAIAGTMPGLNGSVIVNSGLLVLTGDLAMADLIVNGGMVEGDGSAKGVSAPGGAISPGGAATAIFGSDGASTLAAGDTLYVDLDTPTPGTGHDQLAVNGMVTLGATLSATALSPANPGDQFVIVANDGADAVTGTFAGLPNGAGFLVGGTPFRVDYQGGDGNDVALVAGASVALDTAAAAIVEGASGASTDAGLDVVLDQVLAGDVVVHVQITGGSATDGTDVSTLNTDLTIPGGSTSVHVPLNVLGDDTVEPDETVDVTLSVVSGSALGAPSVATVTITNDDAATVTVPNPNVVITEGGPGSQGLALAAVSQLTLALDHASSTDIGVHIATTDGTATAPADYAGFDQVFTIPAGATSFIVPLSIVDDNLDEPDETFTIRFLGATGATLAASDVTVTLVDNDVPTVTPPSTTPGGGTPTMDPGTLPATGGSPNRTIWLAGVLLALGLALVVARRRRTI
jgi:fibronectin-binding autotransporter adhesin